MINRYLLSVASHSKQVLSQAGLYHQKPAHYDSFTSDSDLAWNILHISSQGSDSIIRSRHGIIIGSIFDRETGNPVNLISEAIWSELSRSQGDSIFTSFWGNYVALLFYEEERSIAVLRSPLSDYSCYFCELDGITHVFSDLNTLTELVGKRLEIDWNALTRQLLFGDLREAATCILGVSELRGGERLFIGPNSIRKDIVWTPWDWAKPNITDAAEATQLLKSSIISSIAARASQHPRIILKLSGGLDSSIVAAGLAAGGSRFGCLALTTDDPSGDETRYARQVTERLGVPLIVARRRITDVDVTASAVSRSSRPSARSFLQASDRLALSMASDMGATAIFDGGGGDNVFGAMQSAAPLADCILDSAGRREFWRLARDIAELTDSSLWLVLRRAVGRALDRHRPFRWQVDSRFLLPAQVQSVGTTPDHTWLTPRSGTMPGRMAHVALVAAGESYLATLDALRAAPAVAPLLAQPVVEVSLQIASWLWFQDARSRYIARAAFASDLPSDVIWRRSKGTPGSFVAQLFEHNRPVLRDLLCHGVLARRGLVDRDSLARKFDDPRPVIGHDYIRIMSLADAEVWVRSWQDY
ncbi:asparagine synthase (glutamine-hydrolyzing) [Sphingomonas sp. SORGH_AS 950]|uniref:asparagine synthase-related protein n=1 Tax=Sphingomonas sp. SORGH_AS_0950 TaxID=3041792 RepID=UPI00277E8460|nr:asparagine synthetase B family protein [Sphingomonas sp. SORGH_AS_0950]MDQ1158937.1 asparagine synthase (glutamine-hydrolyzing) [Sphingomonas sp. SORGH_AS_0950]